MIKLLAILLLVPSLSWGKVFNCKMTFTTNSGADVNYELLLDTKNSSSIHLELNLVDKHGNRNWDMPEYHLSSIGHIYFQKGHPYFGKGVSDHQVLFQFTSQVDYVGIIMKRELGPTTIYLRNYSADPELKPENDNWILTVTDAQTNHSNVHKGVCN